MEDFEQIVECDGGLLLLKGTNSREVEEALLGGEEVNGVADGTDGCCLCVD